MKRMPRKTATRMSPVLGWMRSATLINNTVITSAMMYITKAMCYHPLAYDRGGVSTAIRQYGDDRYDRQYDDADDHQRIRVHSRCGRASIGRGRRTSGGGSGRRRHRLSLIRRCRCGLIVSLVTNDFSAIHCFSHRSLE